MKNTLPILFIVIVIATAFVVNKDRVQRSDDVPGVVSTSNQNIDIVANFDSTNHKSRNMENSTKIYKNNFIEELENKFMISACRRDPNADPASGGECRCRNNYRIQSPFPKCVMCIALDINSEGDGNGGCRCRPGFRNDTNGSKKCRSCIYFDINSISNGEGGCQCRSNYVID